MTTTTNLKINTEYGARLHAISGDVVGMGGNDLDRSLEGHEGCYELVRDFLVKQAEASIIHMTDDQGGAAMALRSEVEQARYQAGNRLIEAGIFKSKYDCRTEWILIEDD